MSARLVPASALPETFRILAHEGSYLYGAPGAAVTLTDGRVVVSLPNAVLTLRPEQRIWILEEAS